MIDGIADECRNRPHISDLLFCFVVKEHLEEIQQCIIWWANIRPSSSTNFTVNNIYTRDCLKNLSPLDPPVSFFLLEPDQSGQGRGNREKAISRFWVVSRGFRETRLRHCDYARHSRWTLKRGGCFEQFCSCWFITCGWTEIL